MPKGIENRAHFRFDTGHVSNSKFMDLPGAQLGRRIFSQTPSIIGIAIGQFPYAIIGGGFCLERNKVTDEFAIRRNDSSFQGFDGAPLVGFPFGGGKFGDFLQPVCEDLDQWIRRCLLARKILHFFQYALDDKPGRQKVAFLPVTQTFE